MSYCMLVVEGDALPPGMPVASSSWQRVWFTSRLGASLASAAVLPNEEPYVQTSTDAYRSANQSAKALSTASSSVSLSCSLDTLPPRDQCSYTPPSISSSLPFQSSLATGCSEASSAVKKTFASPSGTQRARQPTTREGKLVTCSCIDSIRHSRLRTCTATYSPKAGSSAAAGSPSVSGVSAGVSAAASAGGGRGGSTASRRCRSRSPGENKKSKRQPIRLGQLWPRRRSSAS
mmetsp:Transcript_35363/g.89748  ORF Transcript_35363/g.89748 Transcript_35363/m.89748 type:complete len:233 (-) Transcript_35363:287-985(-)